MSRAKSASENGLNLVKEFEGRGGVPVLDAFQDDGDLVTIGFGHTGKIRDPDTGKKRELRLGDRITAEYADELLVDDSKEAERRVDRYFPSIPLTQGQRDALVSFCFNLRLDSIISSTLRKMILSGPDIARTSLIEWWVKYRNPRTIFEEGLYRRRIAELCLWFGWPYRLAWEAELRRDKNNEISFISNPELILFRAEAEAKANEVAPPEEDDLADELPAFEPRAKEPIQDKPEIVVSPDVGEKPPSPNTKQPEEVPYGVHPHSGSKPLEESQRFWGTALEALGHFGRTWSTRTVGVAGASAAFLGELLKHPAVITIIAGCIAWVIFFGITQYGRRKKLKGEDNATQLLH